MPISNKFNPYNVRTKNRKVFTVNLFRGVDYNKSKLNIKDYNATNIENFIFKDNVNQKRKGWEKIATIPAIEYRYIENNLYSYKTNSQNINGAYQFLANDNNTYTILHIGNLLLNVKNIGKEYSFLDIMYEVISPIEPNNSDIDTRPIVDYEFNDIKSSGFVSKNKLYLLDGKKFTVIYVKNGKLVYEAVEDSSLTYIPTTTTNITYADSAVDGFFALDDVNMLTQWRKNKLVSGTYFDNGTNKRTTEYWDYTLDANIVPKKDEDLNNVEITISTLVKGVE